MFKFALVISKFNEEITTGLKLGVHEYLKEKGIQIPDRDTYYVPGAFEIPLIAQKLARTKKYSGVICLGCIIKGDTAHFEFISLGATLGLMQGMLNTEIPITFGILTTYTEEQALARSQTISQKGLAENKGREAAAACFEAAEILLRIQKEDTKHEHETLTEK